jgi:hypothetical protein
MLQHGQAIRIYVINNVLFEVVAEMDSDTTHPTKRLEYLFNPALFEAFL